MEMSGHPHAPAGFIPWERAPSSQWIWGWVDPWATRDTLEKNTISSSFQESNHNPMIAQPITYPTHEKKSVNWKHKINEKFTKIKSEAWIVNN